MRRRDNDVQSGEPPGNERNSAETVKFLWDVENDSYLGETDGSDSMQVVYTKSQSILVG